MNILILGRAKTGTTIVAKTIQASLQKHRLWFEPRSLRHFVSGEPKSVVTKVIFEHWDDKPHSRLALINNELEMKFDKRIAIVRDPRDELISRMFYMVRGAIIDRNVAQENVAQWIDVLREKEANPQSVSVAYLLERMGQLLNAHLRFHGGGVYDYFAFVKKRFAADHILRYEPFIDGERDSLAGYLGFPLVAAPAHDEMIDRTRRSASHGNWKALFLESDLADYMAQHGAALAEIGYTDTELAPQSTLDPAHGSEYVARLAAAAYEDKNALQPQTAIPPAVPVAP